MARRSWFFVAALGVGVASCSDDGLRPERGEELGGGVTTNTVVFGQGAFAEPLATLDSAHRLDFFGGNHLFNSSWVTAPGSVDLLDGLGPTFHVDSCSGCHFKDGRGAPPSGTDELVSMLLRISVPGEDAHGGPLGEPTYGGQIQPHGIAGVDGEARVSLTWSEEAGVYGDGTAFSLRRPTVVLDDLAFGPLDASTLFSLRTAPAMIGLGLLESVPEAALLARVDADDADGDGISGRANRVWDVRSGALALGRFGWKAGQPSLEQQNAGAFNGDMGITSSLFPDQNCPSSQPDCAGATAGGSPEIDDARLALLTLYTQALAVPARVAHGEAEVLRGRELFREAGCPSCHVETMRTGADAPLPELAEVDIRPYTDLLLHDLGEGLADHRPEFEASGSEWRTPPLWGLGRIADVNGHFLLLHDGRARGVAEAILWHGGEALNAREFFRTLAARDRAALVRFLESL